MAKKIKTNPFGLSKVGQKKMAAEAIIKNHRMEARESLLKEFTLLLAWTLRANYGFGKKRIEQILTEVFELMSDTKMKDYGQDLLSVDDINPQLKEEVGLDVFELINELATKHFNRVEKAVRLKDFRRVNNEIKNC